MLEKEEKKEKIKSLVKILVITLVLCGAGFFALNQFILYRYNTILLSKPCDLCKKYNSPQAQCIDGCFTNSISLFQAMNGSWQTTSGVCYDSLGRKINCSNQINFTNITLRLI